MKILGIETSCDETAAAVVENGTKILSSVVSSSSNLHQKTGGVIPEIAAREQMRYMVPVLNEAMQNMTPKDIDAIAITVGPGLIGSLLVGVETAKTLSLAWQKPIVPINHLVAHLYANWIETPFMSLRGPVKNKYFGGDEAILSKEKIATLPSVARNDKPLFPALCLIVSGGHTDLVLMQGHGKLRYLGGTRDDAAGECFDKTARLLGLSKYYGGPAIAAAALKSKISNLRSQIRLPRPMIGSNDLDFSFSGLKTAVLRTVEKLKAMKQFNNEAINYLAYETQEAITDVLVAKVSKAVKIYQPKSILLGGGVSANLRLREKLSLKIKNPLFVPPINLCNDNAIYIASCAFFNYKPMPWKKISADPSLTIVEKLS